MTHDQPMPGLLAPQAVLHRLATRFTGVFATETVDRHVMEAYRALATTAAIPAYLPVITEKFAAEQLTAVAQADGLIPKDRTEVLFVCDHNAGRSQIAAALMRERTGERVNIRSAGSQPVAEIAPAVRAALAEVGLNADADFPKPLTDAVVRAADVIVTMGCGDTCPVYPCKRYLDWNLDDPFGRSLPEVRAIRGAIQVRIERLAAELATGTAPRGSAGGARDLVPE